MIYYVHSKKKQEVYRMSEELLNTETMADYEEHFDDANPWNRVADYQRRKTVLTVKIEGLVNGGVIAVVEGIRGFIPASQLSLSYVENLEDYLLKEIDVQIIEADQAENRLVMSAKDLLKEQARKEKEALVETIAIDSVLTGTVESLQNYGAFIRLENGLSGLVHISQISDKRIKTPAAVLTIGQSVDVKVIDIKNGKLSLSMKALIEPEEEIIDWDSWTSDEDEDDEIPPSQRKK